MLARIIVPPNNPSYEAAFGIFGDPWLARTLSIRIPFASQEELSHIVCPNISNLFPNLSLYSDMEKAANRLADAISKRQKIVCAVDFDSDGINSGAIFYRCLSEVFWYDKELFDVQISHRTLWGYGYSEYAVRHIFRKHNDAPPDLILTADQGSSNEAQVKLTYSLAKEHGVSTDVIITDHHEIPGKGPVSAFAFVNPQKDDLPAVMKDVCGATVLWFLMISTYQKLTERGYSLPPGSKAKLFELVAHCAVATISDVMSLASPLNRAICKTGFDFINRLDHPAWRVLRDNVSGSGIVDEETIGFVLAPQINAASRIGLSGETALTFLCSKDMVLAQENYEHLVACNEERKDIGAEMMDVALEAAKKQVEQGKIVIVVFLPKGTLGVSGIVAGRLKEIFHRPAIVMSPSSESEATGSARSIPGLNIRECLQQLYDQQSKLLLKFGGHPMAAGMSVPIHKIDEFACELNKIVKTHVSVDDLSPIMKVDFNLNKLNRPMRIEHAKKLELLKPYGQKFPPPLACVTGEICNLFPMGKKNKFHLRFTLRTEKGHLYPCVWFNARKSEADDWPVKEGVVYTMVVSPSINSFKNKESLQFQVISLGVVEKN